MNKLTIEEMKQVELEIMDEFDRICREHNLVYCIAYGTLLGAVRHKGFIPWDDDMDVIMPREDYETLLEHFNEWRSSDKYELDCYRNGKSFYTFAKIIDTTTIVYENFVRKELSTGIWLDIFPLDRVSMDNKEIISRINRLDMIRNLIVADPNNGSNAAIKAAKKLICPILSKFDVQKYCEKIDKLCLESNKLGVETVGCLITSDVPPLYPISIFETIDMPFEDRIYKAPKDYEEFLSIAYGDWKTPPPENCREIHTADVYRL